jgi:CRISPR/Cas system CSM-associated protein Csm2 small subunit
MSEKIHLIQRLEKTFLSGEKSVELIKLMTDLIEKYKDEDDKKEIVSKFSDFIKTI